MDRFRTLTTVFSLGLDCGLFSRENVIQWCDTMIEVKDTVPYEMIEISLMSKSKVDDILRKLHELSGEIEFEYPVKLVLSILHEKVTQNKILVENAIKYSTRLLVLTGLYFDDEYYSLFSMGDNYDCALSGYHFDITEVTCEYVELLAQYRVFLADFKSLYQTVMGVEWTS